MHTRDGAFIRDMRRRAGLTQAQLATRIGTTQSAVARWERGATSPTLASARRVMDACSLDLSIRGEPQVDPDEWTLIERNRTLTPEQRFDHAVAAARFVIAGRQAMAGVRRDHGRAGG